MAGRPLVPQPRAMKRTSSVLEQLVAGPRKSGIGATTAICYGLPHVEFIREAIRGRREESAVGGSLRRGATRRLTTDPSTNPRSWMRLLATARAAISSHRPPGGFALGGAALGRVPSRTQRQTMA